MTTYNDPPLFLSECIQSILSQTHREFEFVITIEPDDRNTEMLKNIENKDDRVRVLVNDRKLGISGSRNRSIFESSGQYIAIIDGDDYCVPTRLQKQMEFLDLNPDISLVGSNMMLVGCDAKVVGKRTYPESHSEIKKYFLLTMGIANPTVMVRRRDLDEVGLFNPLLSKAEDMDLWLRFLRNGKKMHNLQEELVFYRLPPRNDFKRNKVHMQNIYCSRREHSKFIWKIYERYPSLFLWFFISCIPSNLLCFVLSLNIVAILRKYNKNYKEA